MSYHSTILIVEPSIDLQLLLTYTLRLHGYHVIKADNANEAQRLLSYIAADLYIVEPVYEGVEWLKHTPFKRPTLILSSAPDAEAMAEQVGAMFVRKPYKLDALLAVIKAMLVGKKIVTLLK